MLTKTNMEWAAPTGCPSPVVVILAYHLQLLLVRPAALRTIADQLPARLDRDRLPPAGRGTGSPGRPTQALLGQPATHDSLSATRHLTTPLPRPRVGPVVAAQLLISWSHPGGSVARPHSPLLPVSARWRPAAGNERRHWFNRGEDRDTIRHQPGRGR